MNESPTRGTPASHSTRFIVSGGRACPTVSRPHFCTHSLPSKNENGFSRNLFDASINSTGVFTEHLAPAQQVRLTNSSDLRSVYKAAWCESEIIGDFD